MTKTEATSKLTDFLNQMGVTDKSLTTENLLRLKTLAAISPDFVEMRECINVLLRDD